MDKNLLYKGQQQVGEVRQKELLKETKTFQFFLIFASLPKNEIHTFSFIFTQNSELANEAVFKILSGAEKFQKNY
jgi:hypothetical protein